MNHTETLNTLVTGAAGSDELVQRALADQIRTVQQTISNGVQQFPGDEYILLLDARLGELLSNHPRALASLRAVRGP